MKSSRPPPLLHALLLLGAVLLGLGSAILLRQEWARQTGAAWPWALLAAAGFLGGWALIRSDAGRVIPFSLSAPVSSLPLSPRRKRAGRVLLGSAALISTGLVARLWPDFRDWGGTLLPWLLSVVLVLAGSALLAPPPTRPEPGGLGLAGEKPCTDSGWQFPAWLEIALFLAMSALAVFLRVYRLDEIPPGIFLDETNAATDALRILEGSRMTPFGTGWYGTPSLYIYYMAGMFRLFGPTYFTLRAVSILPAVLTVLAVYPLGRLLFGVPGGLAAMALLAANRWHLTMSRWGWNEIAPPLFQIAATFFLLRGFRSRRAVDFALGGVIAGLMMYTYLSSRLALLTLGTFAVVALFMEKGGPVVSLRRHGRGLALFALAWAITVAPLAVTHIRDPFTFANRVSQVTILNQVRQAGSLQPLLDNLVVHLKSFHQTGDWNARHNLPGEPLATPLLGSLFVVGLGYSLMRSGNPQHFLLWAWVGFAMAGGVFSSPNEAPQAYRTLNAAPAVALMAGEALARLARALPAAIRIRPCPSWKGWLRPRAGLAALVLAAGLGGSAVWESSVYFGPQAASPAMGDAFNIAENTAAREVTTALQDDVPVYLSDHFYYSSPQLFLAYGMEKKKTGRSLLDAPPYHLARPELDLPLPDTGRDALFILDLNYASLVDYLRSYYPDAQMEEVRDRHGSPLYLRLRIPRSNLARLHGLSYQLTYSDGTHAEGITDTIAPVWGDKQVSTAEWSGNLRVERSGPYNFYPTAGLSVRIDGEDWTGPRTLCAGLHSLHVTGVPAGIPAGETTLVGWSTPSDDAAPITPDHLFQPVGAPSGLKGMMYANPSWEGEPVCRVTIPFFLLSWPEGEPVSGPFSATFTGNLSIAQAGLYGFRIHADDGIRLTIDGKVAGESLVPNQPNSIEMQVDLGSGEHPVRLDYFQSGGGNTLQVYWQPPGGEMVPVPPSAWQPE